jgi:hypothetical protein
VRAQAFPAYRIGEGRNSSLRYRRNDVLGWLERNRVNGHDASPEAEAPTQQR